MTLDLNPSIPGPDIAHSGLSAVALDLKTANSIDYVRIHSLRSHSVPVVTQVHNAKRRTSSLPTSKFPWPHSIAAVDVLISQTAATRASCCLRVVLFETREANEIQFQCLHTNLVFSKTFNKLNPVFRKPISVYAAHSDIKACSSDPISPSAGKEVWLRETKVT